MVRAERSPQPEAVQVEGEVRGVRYAAAPRQFAAGLDRLTFHVLPAGRAGRPTDAVPIEVRCGRLGDLVIRDGDHVTVSGSRGESGTLLAHAVVDHTTHSSLDLRAPQRRTVRLRTLSCVLAFVAIPVFLLAIVALYCTRYADALRLGLPCLAVWAAWYLLRKRAP